MTTAVRGGDFEGLLAVLDPARRSGRKGDRLRALRAAHAAALVNGAVGVVVAPGARLTRVLRFTIANGKISEIEVIGDHPVIR